MIQIPSGLCRKGILVDSVVLSVQKLSHWPSLERMPFFPNYSNHGFRHIEQVLETANRLIHKSTRRHLTSQDIAVLIFGAALHDLAMHLTHEGLCRLILGQSTLKTVRNFHDDPYPDLWEKFADEVRRFGPARYKRLFGREDPVALPDPHQPEKWNYDQFKLVGEFVRRHHPRLAHEIALYGYPAAKSELPVLDADFPEPLRNLAGLLARSHGLPLRKGDEYVRKEYSGAYRNPHDTHIHFLMTLLRVGDYLQIQKDRVHPTEAAVELPTSADTQRELAKHYAVEHLSWDTDDPEEIFVTAEPDDVRTYLALRDLFADMQMELDTSWAVLSEVYKGSHFELSKRRIRSLLEDRSFGDRVEYLPEHAAFHADARLLKELAGPLYANQPEFGIRELVQNAVDAVRQFGALRTNGGPNVEQPELEADVVVTLRKTAAGASIEVADRGIGMSSAIILEYFLKVGAFYDDEGSPWHSRALRAGYFGVGVLAAFLLSYEIEVETRRAGEKHGWTFSARIDSDPVDIRKHERAVGTTIRLRISDELYERLKSLEDRWDWYCLRSPSVIRLIDEGTPRRLEQRAFLPSPQEPEVGWRALSTEPGVLIYWKYSSAKSDSDLPLREYVAVNGLLVAETDRFYKDVYLWRDSRSRFRVRLPALSITGPASEVRLNLQRTSVDFEHCRFYMPLVIEIVTQSLKRFLSDGMPPERCTMAEYFKTYYESFQLYGVGGNPGNSNLPSWLLFPGCVAPFEAAVLQRLGSDRIQVISVEGERPYGEDGSCWFSPPASILDEVRQYLVGALAEGIPKVLIEDDTDTVAAILSLHDGDRSHSDLSVLPAIGARSLLNARELRKHLTTQALGAILQRAVWREGPWVLLETGTCAVQSLDFRQLANDAGPDSSGLYHIASEIFLDPRAQVYESPLAAVWNQHMAQPFIPFDQAERERLHAGSLESMETVAVPTRGRGASNRQ